MSILSAAQTELAVKLMHEYLAAGPDERSGLTPVAESARLDADRRTVIEQRLLPLLGSFMAGRTSLEDFKPALDGINKQHELWGFKGIKGQMFFNLVFNAATELAELTAELKAALPAPDTEEVAKSRIRTFTSYVKRLGDERVDAGGSKHARPKVSSVPFFLSYFWQLQAPQRWAVYYTNSVDVLTDLNLLEPVEDLADAYGRYQAVHVELRDVFSTVSGRSFTLYDVEHVWWQAGRRRREAAIEAPGVPAQVALPGPLADASLASVLPDSYVPPIVAILSRLAANDASLAAAANASGISIARAFEKSINAALTILGYETRLMGQGTGRAPDGVAIADDESYAILWDAKARNESYRMGTDDRAIREYVQTQSRELKRRRHYRNLYYVIVSSRFQDEFDELVRSLKMDTDINEVCLMEADALIELVDRKLRDPRSVSLGPDGIQRVFHDSRTVTAQTVRDVVV